MNDRELLELAALAAGYFVKESGNLLLLMDDNECNFVWNPLADDGDAFRLAVKLRIDLSHWFNAVEAETENNHCVEAYTNDPNAAARCAIVKVAAAIGKAKENDGTDSR